MLLVYPVRIEGSNGAKLCLQRRKDFRGAAAIEIEHRI